MPVNPALSTLLNIIEFLREGGLMGGRSGRYLGNRREAYFRNPVRKWSMD